MQKKKETRKNWKSLPESEQQSRQTTHRIFFSRNLNKSNRNQIVFSIFRFIWNQTGIRLFPNQSEKDKYKLISV